MTKSMRELSRELSRHNIAMVSTRVTSGNHHCIVIATPDGDRKIFASSTPSDRRSMRNIVAQARRMTSA